MNIRQKTRFHFALVLVLGVVAGFFAYPRAAHFYPPAEDFLNRFNINLGLDLQGGIHLEYAADTSQVPNEKKTEALQAAEAVIERRVNAFGVGEPLVQLSHSGNEDRIIVELPGVKDIEQAKSMIKETPFLEFKEEAGPETEHMFDQANEQAKLQAEQTLVKIKKGADFESLAKELSQDPASKDKGGDLDFVKKGIFVPEFDSVIFKDDFKKGEVYPDLVESQFGWHIIKKLDERPASAEGSGEATGQGSDKEVRAAHILFRKQSIDMYPSLQWVSTGLTGKNLKDAYVEYPQQGLGQPQVALRFDDEGAQLFADLTKKNIGKGMAIYVDGLPITDTNGDGTIDAYDPPYAPTIQSEITGGQAVITGNFTTQEAKHLVARFNEGALPIPITLVGQQSVSASLGEASLKQSLYAGTIGIVAVMVFMILYYRFLGLIAAFALLLYSALLVSIFKLSGLTPFPITLTLAGIAGFVLSVGMAVDANILIFERTWEELRYGKSLSKAIHEGFRRAWTSIRDGNVSTAITCFILIWMGTGFVKGFAVILLIGVLFSMFTAIVLVRALIRFLLGDWVEKRLWLIAPKRVLLHRKAE